MIFIALTIIFLVIILCALGNAGALDKITLGKLRAAFDKRVILTDLYGHNWIRIRESKEGVEMLPPNKDKTMFLTWSQLYHMFGNQGDILTHRFKIEAEDEIDARYRKKTSDHKKNKRH